MAGTPPAGAIVPNGFTAAFSPAAVVASPAETAQAFTLTITDLAGSPSLGAASVTPPRT